jgi:hypothetical protein
MLRVLLAVEMLTLTTSPELPVHETLMFPLLSAGAPPKVS